MPQRSQPLPEAATESARAARKSFYCDLCSKGYSRMNEFEAHENSYDHQHRRRLKELRQVTKDPNAASRARLAEERANEESGLRAISSSKSLVAGAGSGQGDKKKPRFKSTLQPHNVAAVTGKTASAAQETKPPPSDEAMVAGATIEEAGTVTSHTAPSLDVVPGAKSTTLERGEGMWEYEDEEVDPNDLPPEAGEWWAEAYRPRDGPTRLRDVEFVYGRLQMA